MACCQYYDHNSYLLAGFYAEPEDSLDMVFIGASEVVADFSSAYAYDLYGFTSYPYALDNNIFSLYTSQLTEVLNQQDPQWIVIDINGVLYSDGSVYRDDVRLLRYLNNIPSSWNRIRSIREMVPAENQYYFFFPLAKVHGNWKEAWNQRYQILQYQKNRQNGLVLKGNITYSHVFGAVEARDISKDDSEQPLEMESERYLRAFLEHCRDAEIHNIIFVRLPHIIQDEESYGRFQRGNAAERIIAEYAYPYIDLEQNYKDYDLDYAADFYDIDHMNVSGQKKLTEYLGRILVEDYSMEGNVRDPDVQAAWDTTAAYNRLFYQYCDEQLTLESKLWISEDDKMMQLLDQMKTGE